VCRGVEVIATRRTRLWVPPTSSCSPIVSWWSVGARWSSDRERCSICALVRPGCPLLTNPHQWRSEMIHVNARAIIERETPDAEKI
jgi:hypothetical protein